MRISRYLVVGLSAVALTAGTAVYLTSDVWRIAIATRALPGLPAAENVLAIRDYVHRNNVVGTSEPLPSDAAVFDALGSSAQLCGGMSLAMAWASNKLGVPARVVQLAGDDFLAGRDLYQTHVTVEVFIDGKWQISDPTYNASVSCSDGTTNLSVTEARACVVAGHYLAGVPPAYVAFLSAYGPIVRDAKVEAIGYFPAEGWVPEALSLYD